jgi:hypothetical protein
MCRTQKVLAGMIFTTCLGHEPAVLYHDASFFLSFSCLFIYLFIYLFIIYFLCMYLIYFVHINSLFMIYFCIHLSFFSHLVEIVTYLNLVKDGPHTKPLYFFNDSYYVNKQVCVLAVSLFILLLLFLTSRSRLRLPCSNMKSGSGSRMALTRLFILMVRLTISLALFVFVCFDRSILVCTSLTFYSFRSSFLMWLLLFNQLIFVLLF